MIPGQTGLKQFRHPILLIGVIIFRRYDDGFEHSKSAFLKISGFNETPRRKHRGITSLRPEAGTWYSDKKMNETLNSPALGCLNNRNSIGIT